VDDALPRTDFALANGAVAHAGGPRAADWLENRTASIRENTPRPSFPLEPRRRQRAQPRP
jgi:hypothetical protein